MSNYNKKKNLIKLASKLAFGTMIVKMEVSEDLGDVYVTKKINN